MDTRKSLAIAMFVSSVASPALAADWSGPFIGITGGGGGGDQTQNGGILKLPSSGGRKATTKGTTTSGASGSVTTVGSSGSVTTITTMTTVTTITTTTIGSSSFSSTTVVADGRYHLHGGLVGGAVGYNWQKGQFVYGIVGDGSWSDISGGGTCGLTGAAPHGCGGGIYALGTVRGRIGYDITPALSPFTGLLIYGAGGLAVADVHASDALFNTSGSRVIPGWTAGVGLEALIGQHWSISVEYLHVDLGTHGLFTAIPPNVERVRTTADLGRVGLSYHFNSLGPPAVVAKY